MIARVRNLVRDGIDEKSGTVPARWGTRAVGWRNARFVSRADGLLNRKIQRVEELCPVVKAPFASIATSSNGGGAALTCG
jgi:hypothetical protein